MNATQLSLFDNPPKQEKQYLWVNVCDLDLMGRVGTMGSPLMFMVRPDLGDVLLPDAVYNDKKIDDMFCIIEATPDRIEAIQGGLSILGKHKINRNIRTRVSVKPPNNSWRRTK